MTVDVRRYKFLAELVVDIGCHAVLTNGPLTDDFGQHPGSDLIGCHDYLSLASAGLSDSGGNVPLSSFLPENHWHLYKVEIPVPSGTV